MAQTDENDELTLIREAQKAISDTNWTLGRVADAWLTNFANGESLEKLAQILKTNHAWLVAYCRVWRRFANERAKFPHLRWVHFLMVEDFDDWQECLEWANEHQATVEEMFAWRMLQKPHPAPLAPHP